MKKSRSKLKSEFKKSVYELREFAKKHINERIADIANKENMPNDILSIILNLKGERIIKVKLLPYIKFYLDSSEYDIEELIDHFITFFIAGQETTANTLAFSILELAQNPNVLDK